MFLLMTLYLFLIIVIYPSICPHPLTPSKPSFSRSTSCFIKFLNYQVFKKYYLLYTYLLFSDIFSYFCYYLHYTLGFSSGSSGEESTWQCWRCKRDEFEPWSGRPLKEGVATHSSILAWRIPWTEEPDMLQSMGSQRIRHN